MIGTIEDIKTRLDMTGSGDDAVLTQIADQIDQLIKTYLDRNIEEKAYEDYPETIYDTIERYYTKDYPIKANTVKVTNNNVLWTEGTQYDVNYEQGIIYFHSSPSRGFKKIKIEYTAGYGSGDIPDDLNLAFVNMCTSLYTDNSAGGIKSESLGDYSVTYGNGGNVDNLVGNNTNILDKYRRYV